MSVLSINDLLEQTQQRGGGFVAFFSPRTDCPRLFVCSTEEIHHYPSLKSLPSRRGFVIAPFATDADTPVVFLDLSTCSNLANRYKWQFLPANDYGSNLKSEADETYRSDFARFSSALSLGQFDKLVLARQAHLPQEGGTFDPVSTFLNAHATYPDAYTYLLYTPMTGLWLGSTPEVLLQGHGGAWATMALAGTQSKPDGADVLPQWSDKNIREQAFVTTYLLDRLASLGIQAEHNSPYTVEAGRLIHLRTDITFRTDGSLSLGDLLGSLHPTPAVCGLPKEEAMAFINHNETDRRGYYSGCLGFSDPEGEQAIYVNLRCLSLTDGRIMLYAGGGLLPTSSLEDEWIETERKMQTMKSVLITQD